jgi:hypothetical protein
MMFPHRGSRIDRPTPGVAPGTLQDPIIVLSDADDGRPEMKYVSVNSPGVSIAPTCFLISSVVMKPMAAGIIFPRMGKQGMPGRASTTGAG